MAGVIPPIFASSIILFPATIAGWFGSAQGMGWLQGYFDIDVAWTADVCLVLCDSHHLLLFLSIRHWCFNPKETAENLQKSGAFIPGIRPGEQTTKYIDSVMGRLTLAGAIYISAVCLLPEFLNSILECPVLFRWYITADYCCRCDGLCVASAIAHDVSAI